MDEQAALAEGNNLAIALETIRNAHSRVSVPANLVEKLGGLGMISLMPVQNYEAKTKEADMLQEAQQRYLTVEGDKQTLEADICDLEILLRSGWHRFFSRKTALAHEEDNLRQLRSRHVEMLKEYGQVRTDYESCGGDTRLHATRAELRGYVLVERQCYVKMTDYGESILRKRGENLRMLQKDREPRAHAQRAARTSRGSSDSGIAEVMMTAGLGGLAGDMLDDGKMNMSAGVVPGAVIGAVASRAPKPVRRAAQGAAVGALLGGPPGAMLGGLGGLALGALEDEEEGEDDV